ncbi:ATP-dependent DNA helicase PIF2-like [Coffea eugenioides]|uniref:ATP-dependent DNA helicase PIF2-like n=1 Tax=Coffea eugenioides TaxID=49369 RepID=UPI000F612463|nr:ATP-dependent DNA helicase PIF2-like [Coffea eugenioides]
MVKNVNDYHLVLEGFSLVCDEQLTKEIESERTIPFTEEDLLLSSRLNEGQKRAYDVILAEVYSSGNKSFFVDGPGGTGKTFLYHSRLATLRSQGYIAIAVASSGIAVSILPGRKTAHSRFKIPLDVSMNKTCQISKQSSVAKLISLAKLIFWDEASMAKKDNVEAFDLLLKDVMNSDILFGGKIVVFGGDFRQTLPVIPSASRGQQIEASFVNSSLWNTLTKLSLSENMRAILDLPYSDFLLRVGEGLEPEDLDGKISLRQHLLIRFSNKNESLNRLVDFAFSDLCLYSLDPYRMINRCVLTPKNSCVDDINEMMIDRFPG